MALDRGWTSRRRDGKLLDCNVSCGQRVCKARECSSTTAQGRGPVGETVQLSEGDRCVPGAQGCMRQHEGVWERWVRETGRVAGCMKVGKRCHWGWVRWCEGTCSCAHTMGWWRGARGCAKDKDRTNLKRWWVLDEDMPGPTVGVAGMVADHCMARWRKWECMQSTLTVHHLLHKYNSTVLTCYTFWHGHVQGSWQAEKLPRGCQAEWEPWPKMVVYTQLHNCICNLGSNKCSNNMSFWYGCHTVRSSSNPFILAPMKSQELVLHFIH